MSSAQLVKELVSALSGICELETDIMNAFRDAMTPIVEKHVATLGSSTGEKVKLTKKGAVAKTRTSKPKEDKLTTKNGYHFFVAAKMGEVKAANVPAKERMKKIGEMWKGLDDAGKQPFKSMAERYNAHIATESKSADWKDRKEAIVAAANAAATAGTGISAGALADADDADETATVATVATAPVATPAPVVAPVVTPAPVAAAKRAAKKAAK